MKRFRHTIGLLSVFPRANSDDARIRTFLFCFPTRVFLFPKKGSVVVWRKRAEEMQVEKTAVSVWLEGLHLPEYKEAFNRAGYINMSDLVKLTKEDVMVCA